MIPLQIWIVETFGRMTSVAALMRTEWAWPLAESVHFIGLTLLIGTIGLFDLRLLGLGRRIPIALMHRLVPWGLAGFAVTAGSGLLFLMTEPDQYVYHVSFHLKVVFILAAGVNALVFYATSFRQATAAGAPLDAPLLAKVVAVVSLTLWMSVIVAGRLLTFYRPFPCEPPRPRFLAACLPGDFSEYASPHELNR